MPPSWRSNVQQLQGNTDALSVSSTDDSSFQHLGELGLEFFNLEKGSLRDNTLSSTLVVVEQSASVILISLVAWGRA
jgi:hypothetical protein